MRLFEQRSRIGRSYEALFCQQCRVDFEILVQDEKLVVDGAVGVEEFLRQLRKTLVHKTSASKQIKFTKGRDFACKHTSYQVYSVKTKNGLPAIYCYSRRQRKQPCGAFLAMKQRVYDVNLHAENVADKVGKLGFKGDGHRVITCTVASQAP